MKDLLPLWEQDDFVRFNKVSLLALGMAEDQAHFLQEIGLPDEAGPYLSFNADLETVNKAWNLDDTDLDSKIVLGSDGCGDPICIESGNQKVYACDHEAYFLPRYMNGSVMQLFQYLSYFKEFASNLSKPQLLDALIKFSDEELAAMTSKMEAVDPLALQHETFWDREIRTLLSNRDA